MKKTLIPVAIFILIYTGNCYLYAQQNPSARYPIIPYPAYLKPSAANFMIDQNTSIYVDAKEGLFQQEAVLLQASLSKAGKQVAIAKTGGKKNRIVLKFDSTLANEEAYLLAITSTAAVLSAKTPIGMFYAIKTFEQLLPQKEASPVASITVPAVSIKDKPAFKWRGMMLDVARAFFSMEYLEKMADMMAMYKLNKLHLHLTDDQGWRIEIKKYPALTSEGGWRQFNEMDSAALREYAKTGNPDFIIDPRNLREKDGRPLFGGYYTQEQMTRFIQYAQERHIEVIPEVDMPGHMMAATRIFPNLTCDGKTGEMRGFSPPVCPCKEEVIDFAKDIFSEIAALFPSRYIHIGGDEVDQQYWTNSPLCQAFMKEHGLTSVLQIQSYFNNRMKDFFATKGKTLVGWDEIVEGGIDSSAVVMYWRPWAPQTLTKAARNKHKIILSPDGPLYFDWIPDQYTLPSVYHYNPLDSGYHFSAEEQKNILGVQGNLWGELLPSEQRADYMMMPRMTALAEVGWTHRPAYASYLSRLDAQYPRWDAMHINYRLPDIEHLVEQNVLVDSASFFKKTPSDNFVLRYTLDGSRPVKNSPILKQPIRILERTTVMLAPFTKNGRIGDVYRMQFEPSSYKEAIVVAGAKPGLRCEYYQQPMDRTTLMKGLPDSILKVDNIAIPAFMNKPSFGFKLKGFLQVPVTGIYSFYFNADDGGMLRLDDAVLIDNEGPHGEKELTAQKALNKGLHPLEVAYVQGGGGSALSLKYSVNGSAVQPVPASWYYSKP